MSVSWLIYKHTCTISGKSYIGLTKKSIEQRWKEHCYASKNRNNSNNYFYNAISLYGESAWESTVLVKNITTYEEAQNQEKYYILKYDTFENGYNTTYGGEGVHGYVYTDEHKKEISIERRNRKGNKLYSFYNPELNILELDIHIMDLSAKYNIAAGNLWYVIKHKSLQAEGWYLWKGREHSYTNKVEFSFEHEVYGAVVGTLTAIAKQYNVCRKALARILNGKVLEYSGWTLPGNQHLIPEVRKYRYVTAYDSITGADLCIYPTVAAAAGSYNVTPKVIKSRCQNVNNTPVNGVLFKYTYKGD